MILDFNNIEEQSIPHFKGGEKSLEARMFFDGQVRILMGRLQPGASIGLHTHETSSEVIFLTKGNAKLIYDGTEQRLTAGQCHYCPKGHSHTLINDTEEDVCFKAVVQEQ